MQRVGFGYDAHRLEEGRALVLGGVTISHHLGLAGHSDADVLIHAIVDAVIGALGKGDIGMHFPDNDETYRDVSSCWFLEKAALWIRDAGMVLNNVDATIVAQRPRLSPYEQRMRKSLADMLSVREEQINIKAKTTEGMGFCGREEGISAYAVVSLETLNPTNL
ncbi:MAG: 2-C-methyl-D-erythritol 2,4-cyclodiphosphate synthase [Deltaproteobacteria bacterium CG_4_10_14_3_um_filter_51_14]|nr:MAG: 2-C-methyl-D-erythritol 2,4-cyclodiphosphate synthase [Deltaproteobacteria bacterium CG_4_10_14_3_um_filter_51_14]